MVVKDELEKMWEKAVSTSRRGGPGSKPGVVMWDLWWTK
jgi:hypothetical protein